MGLTGLRYSHVCDFSLMKVFSLTGTFREHPFLYEMSSVPGKISFRAGFSSY